MLSLVAAVSSAIASQQASLRASQSAAGATVSTKATAAVAQGPTSGAGVVAQASAQAGSMSASTSDAASAMSTKGSAPSVTASSKASAGGLSSINAAVSASTNSGGTGMTAKSISADAVSLDRHFAIGMQESAGAQAADRLSGMLAEGPGASDVAASLESSQKRFQSIVSQLATSGGLTSAPANDDSRASSANTSGDPTASVRGAYADNAA